MWVVNGKSWALMGGEREAADRQEEEGVQGRGLSFGKGVEQDWERMESLRNAKRWEL